jgi:hypothetical protein
MKLQYTIPLLVLALLFPSIARSADKVVVIPLHSKSSRTQGTQLLSVPAAAFHAFKNSIQYTNDGKEIYCTGGTECSFLTPVYLPDGAMISELTVFYEDCHDDNALVSLQRITQDGVEASIIGLYTYGGANGTGGDTCVKGSETKDTLYINEPIDNSTYSYYIWLNLPYTSDTARVTIYSVQLKYEAQ